MLSGPYAMRCPGLLRQLSRHHFRCVVVFLRLRAVPALPSVDTVPWPYCLVCTHAFGTFIQPLPYLSQINANETASAVTALVKFEDYFDETLKKQVCILQMAISSEPVTVLLLFVLQDSLRPYDDPVLTDAGVKLHAKAVVELVQRLARKPKPTPTPTPTPSKTPSAKKGKGSSTSKANEKKKPAPKQEPSDANPADKDDDIEEDAVDSEAGAEEERSKDAAEPEDGSDDTQAAEPDL